MAVYSAVSRDDRIAQINITPLVDVMLVLLVIFMISAPALTRTMELDIGRKTKKDQAPPPRIELSVDASGQYTLDGRSIDRGALSAELAAVAQRAPNAIVRIATSRDADYQAFATALSLVRGSGVQNVDVTR